MFPGRLLWVRMRRVLVMIRSCCRHRRASVWLARPVDGSKCRHINVRYACQSACACALWFGLQRHAVVGFCRNTFAVEVGGEELIANTTEARVTSPIAITHVTANIVLQGLIWLVINWYRINDNDTNETKNLFKEVLSIQLIAGIKINEMDYNTCTFLLIWYMYVYWIWA